ESFGRAQRDVGDHQAALAEAEQEDVFGAYALSLELLQQRQQKDAAAQDARLHVPHVVVPAVAAVVGVGRVDEQVGQLRNTQGVGQEVVTVQGVAQAVQYDDDALARTRDAGGDVTMSE